MNDRYGEIHGCGVLESEAALIGRERGKRCARPRRAWNFTNKVPAKPHIGIFWTVPATREGSAALLIAASRPFDKTREVCGFRTLEEGHIDIWPRVTAELMHLQGTPYEAYPRGRVNWRAEDAHFLLILDRALFGEPFASAALARFGLPGSATLFMADPHYRSARGVTRILSDHAFTMDDVREN